MWVPRLPLITVCCLLICTARVHSYRIPTEKDAPITCLSLKGSDFKLCADDPMGEFFRYMTIRKRLVGPPAFPRVVHKAPYRQNSVLQGRTRSIAIEDVFPAKADNSNSVQKRPFDSISFSNGLDGFKR